MVAAGCSCFIRNRYYQSTEARACVCVCVLKYWYIIHVGDQMCYVGCVVDDLVKNGPNWTNAVLWKPLAAVFVICWGLVGIVRYTNCTSAPGFISNKGRLAQVSSIYSACLCLPGDIQIEGLLSCVLFSNHTQKRHYLYFYDPLISLVFRIGLLKRQ